MSRYPPLFPTAFALPASRPARARPGAKRPLSRSVHQRGLALLEILIGVVLGLLTVMVMVQTFGIVERSSQANASQADAQQRGAVALWRVQRELRLAGAGLGHSPGAWGCAVNAWRDGTRLLPRTGTWPAPFASLPTTLLLTPLAVGNDAGPGATDLVVFASGRGAAGVLPANALIASAASVSIGSTSGYRRGDLLLMTPSASAGACQIGQVDSTFTVTSGVAAPSQVPTTTVGAPYNTADGFTTLAQPAEYSLINLGSTPSIQMLGVNDRGQLVLLDALRMMTAADPVVLTENVRDLQILYGLDDGVGTGLANDNIIDRWVAPDGSWAFANLHSAATAALQVKALRLAIVVRSDQPQGRVGPAELTLFPDLPEALRKTLSFTTAERQYQFQVYESVIALRNQAMALCSEERRNAGVPAPSICD